MDKLDHLHVLAHVTLHDLLRGPFQLSPGVANVLIHAFHLIMLSQLDDQVHNLVIKRFSSTSSPISPLSMPFCPFAPFCSLSTLKPLLTLVVLALPVINVLYHITLKLFKLFAQY